MGCHASGLCIVSRHASAAHQLVVWASCLTGRASASRCKPCVIIRALCAALHITVAVTTAGTALLCRVCKLNGDARHVSTCKDALQGPQSVASARGPQCAGSRERLTRAHASDARSVPVSTRPLAPRDSKGATCPAVVVAADEEGGGDEGVTVQASGALDGGRLPELALRGAIRAEVQAAQDPWSAEEQRVEVRGCDKVASARGGKGSARGLGLALRINARNAQRAQHAADKWLRGESCTQRTAAAAEDAVSATAAVPLEDDHWEDTLAEPPCAPLKDYLERSARGSVGLSDLLLELRLVQPNRTVYGHNLAL
mmetsp:Transcript_100696/g.324939  ORF Transcript_100696/g.324939 Transcript_100696/m.324939 type:complete len:313 (-) Transcript_100696:147-1085(-)